MPLSLKQRIPISRHVRDFACEHGLTNCLPKLVELFERIFSEASQLTIAVDEDPEVAELRHMSFRAVVPWRTFEESKAARDAWYAGSAAVCSSESLPLIRLQIERRPT